MSESDSDYEEEELILFADFKNNLMFSDNEDASNQIKIIGIDSDTPIAEVNGNIFKGKYDYSMGTHVFFEEDEDAQIIDPIYENHAKVNFKFFTKTNKVLNFTRIFVEPEAGFSELRSENASDTKQNDLTSLKVDITYEEALKQLKPPESK